MDSLFNGLSGLDIAFLSAAAGAVAYYFLFKQDKNEDLEKELQLPSLTSSAGYASKDNFSQGLLQRMKKSNKTVVIFYGSQTGTAEEFSNRLAKDAQRLGLKAMVVDPEEVEAEDIVSIAEIENSLAVFCMATYGEGDPTDNAQQMYDFIKSDAEEGSFNGLNYAVFALGNKTYEHFNAVGKFFDKRLEQLGGERMYEVGIGDDDTNIEEDFVTWKELFWAQVIEKFQIEVDAIEGNFRTYDYKEMVDCKKEKVFTGEISRLHSYEKQKGPYDAKNPYLAKVTVNRELHKGGGRSCLHLELDITGSKIGYNAGDHVAIYPTNDAQMVDSLCRRLQVDAEHVFTMNNVDEDSNKRHPFPCPTTFGTAFTHYLDITNPLRTNVLHELAAYCTEEKDKEFLLLLSSKDEQGKKQYQQWAMNERRTLLQVLEDVPSCQPQIGHLLELIPRLQVRYYSIASSPRKHPNSIHVCAAVVKYEASNNRTNYGVATKYLTQKQPATSDHGDDDEEEAVTTTTETSTVPIFVRRSQFHLPFKVSNPVLMIGPGTGIAPFIGFIQDREFHKNNNKDIGKLILYFGCRKKSEDFIYQESLESWKDEGLLTELNLAFSRDGAEKVYVQHQLKTNKATVWDVINNNGHIYVCGDAKYMARDVQDTIVAIVEEFGGKTHQQAQDFVKKMMSKGRYSCDVW